MLTWGDPGELVRSTGETADGLDVLKAETLEVRRSVWIAQSGKELRIEFVTGNEKPGAVPERERAPERREAVAEHPTTSPSHSLRATDGASRTLVS